MNPPSPAPLTAPAPLWQPIETAPLDCIIDLWVMRFIVRKAGKVTVEHVGRVTDARWDTISYFRERRGEECGKFVEGDEPQWIHHVDCIDREAIETETDKATHWMPLPEPPAALEHAPPAQAEATSPAMTAKPIEGDVE